MDFFEFLKIEPTNDKVTIKKAYMQLLPQYHPEEDKEGFIRLRQAYEGALQWQPQTDVELTEEDLILNEAKEIYGDFQRRIDVNKWRAWLRADACNQIDSQWIVAQKLLDFFQDHFYLPNEIIGLIVDHFCLDEKQDELEQLFHPNFIHFILNAKEWSEWIRFEYFTVEEGKSYDTFLEIAYGINGYLNENNLDKVKESLDQLDDFGIYHIDVEIYKVRYYLATNEMEKAEAVADALVARYPENTSALYALGQVTLQQKNYEKSKEIFTKLSENSPGIGTKRSLAEAHYGLGEYVAAKDLFYAILTESPYDYGASDYFYRTNEALTTYYTELSEAEPTEENCFLLAKAYYNTKNYDQCLALLEKVDPLNVETKKYYSLKMECYYQSGNYSAILEQIETLTEEDKDVFKTLALYGVHEYEKTLEYIEEALTRYPENYRILLVKSDILLEQKQYEDVLALTAVAVTLTNYTLPFLISKTKALHALQHYAEAIEAGDQALQVYPYLVDIFVIKAKIYHTVEDYDACLEVCNEALERGLEDKELFFYKAVALRHKEAYEESLTLLEPLREEMATEGRVFYELAYDYMELRRKEEALEAVKKAMELEKDDVYHSILAGYICHRFEDLKEALDIFEKALALERRQEEIYNRMGIIYLDLKDNKEAIECFEKSIAIDDSYPYPYANLGDLFRDEKQEEKAIEYYEKAIALYENPSYIVGKGICHFELNQYEAALAAYERAVEIDPDYLWGRNCLAYLYYMQRNYEKALEEYLYVHERDPYYEVAMRNLANTYKKLNEPEKALALYDTLIEKYEERPAILEMQYRKGMYLTVLNRYTESIQILTALIKEDPKNVEYCDELATALLLSGELKKAEKVLKQGLKWHPKDTTLLYLRIEIIAFGYGKYRTAQKYCKQLLKIDPEHYKTWTMLGKCSRVLKKKESVTYFQKAKDILEQKVSEDPDWVCGKVFLAETLFYLGQVSESEIEYRRIIQENLTAPYCFREECFEAYFGLCLIAEQNGNFQEAIRLCQRAIEITPELEYFAKKKILEKK